MPIDLSIEARTFRENARKVRPHPANPHKVDAAAVSRFVDVDCAYAAQLLDDAQQEIAKYQSLMVWLRSRVSEVDDNNSYWGGPHKQQHLTAPQILEEFEKRLNS